MNKHIVTKYSAGACLALFLLLAIGSANSADILPNEFVSGSTLTATQLNDVRSAVNSNAANVEMNVTDINNHNHDASYYTKSETDTTFAKKVTNFASNADFSNGSTGWSVDTVLSTSTMQIVNVTAPFGSQAVQNDENQTLWATSDDIITIDHNQTYEVKGAFRRLAGGTTGSIYLAVKLMDATGAVITGDGTWWYYLVSNYVPPADAWVEYKAQFGKGTSRPFPSEAVTATVGFILNYNDGDRIYQVQGLSMHTSTPNSQWTDLIFETGVTNYGFNYQSGQYRKTGDGVCLRGLISYAGAAGVDIAILPPTFRPPAILIFNTGDTGQVTDRVDVYANGAIRLLQTNGDTFISLTGICFSTSP